MKKFSKAKNLPGKITNILKNFEILLFLVISNDSIAQMFRLEKIFIVSKIQLKAETKLFKVVHTSIDSSIVVYDQKIAKRSRALANGIYLALSIINSYAILLGNKFRQKLNLKCLFHRV